MFLLKSAINDITQLFPHFQFLPGELFVAIGTSPANIVKSKLSK
jgi:hypothetical protein